ncbi:hypothetical protein KM043_010929 [Ampulex compressa]|nr:hypothetical protein KM043_010929 [Ampulex compressa]
MKHQQHGNLGQSFVTGESKWDERLVPRKVAFFYDAGNNLASLSLHSYAGNFSRAEGFNALPKGGCSPQKAAWGAPLTSLMYRPIEIERWAGRIE